MGTLLRKIRGLLGAGGSWGVYLSLFAQGCVTQGSGELGYSDVSYFEEETYVVVFDTKGFEDEARIGLLTLEDAAVPSLLGLTGIDWKDPRSKASDLEAICAVPGRGGEFLVLESGSWEDRPGRIFRLEVIRSSARVLGADDMPTLAPNDPDQTGDQYEGMACAPRDEGKILVVLGERGGSAAYPRGVLRWGVFDLGTNEFQRLPGGEEGEVVSAPGVWPASGGRRDITGLYLDEGNTLWASAAVDGGDLGPFHSAVYAVALVDATADTPVGVIPGPVVEWEILEHKIEGLAAPPPSSRYGSILAAFEDEMMGGDGRILQGAGR